MTRKTQLLSHKLNSLLLVRRLFYETDALCIRNFSLAFYVTKPMKCTEAALLITILLISSPVVIQSKVRMVSWTILTLNCSLPEISRNENFYWKHEKLAVKFFSELYWFWANFINFLLLRIFDNSFKILTFFDILKNIEKCICAEKCFWNVRKNF